MKIQTAAGLGEVVTDAGIIDISLKVEKVSPLHLPPWSSRRKKKRYRKPLDPTISFSLKIEVPTTDSPYQVIFGSLLPKAAIRHWLKDQNLESFTTDVFGCIERLQTETLARLPK